MTKSSENIWVFDSNRDILDNWREASPLSYAWFGFAAHEAKEKYRDSGNRPPNFSAFLELDMQLELRSQIAKGDFIAMGIQVSPIPKGEPEQIPPICFEAYDVEIDWQKDGLSGLGRSFHDVRLCLPQNKSRAVHPGPLVISIANTATGRPSQYPKAKEVFEILFSDRCYSDLPAAKLLHPFNEAFVARFSARDIKIAPIGERSLRTYLKKYRKESAETGKI